MRIARVVGTLLKPLVPRVVLEPVLRRRFFATRRWQNQHWGVFESFARARAYAEAHDATTRYALDHREGLRRHQSLRPHDYPVLYWLARLRPAFAGGRLVDFGGSIGSSYYAYRRHLELAPDVSWTVCDLTEVIAEGRAIAAENGEQSLAFTDRVDDIDGANVLFAAGCLQFVEQPLADLLGAMREPPRHIIINRLALTDGAGYVTLQNTGFAIAPCRVDNAAAFVASIAALGYSRQDSWRCLENSLTVPFHPERALDHFHGFYFSRETAASRAA